MKLLYQLFLIVFLILKSFIVGATINVYPFEEPSQEKRFNVLIKELRCPKCQNNNLADSNAALAIDLKNIIYEKIIAGESDEEIVNYLKIRYGDFISYRPPLKPSTWVIWFGPFVLLVIGGFGIFRFVKARRQLKSSIPTQDISQEKKDLLMQWTQQVEVEKNDVLVKGGEKIK